MIGSKACTKSKEGAEDIYPLGMDFDEEIGSGGSFGDEGVSFAA